MAGYVIGEGVGQATIVATRSGGSGGLFTVNYTTADGTAQAGVGYLPASGTLTFDPGVDVQTFTVPILDNGLPAGDTSVLLVLSNPKGPIALGTQSMAVLTILGNQPGAFQFAMAGFAVNQAAGTATITVDRQQGGTTASVNYATSDGTAVAGIDYVATSGTLTFGPGVLVETFTVPILINPAIKGNETVLLNLSSPTGGAALGPPSSAVLTIVDDGIDRKGPHVTSVKAVSGPYGTAEIVIGFDEPLNPATAVNLLNYGYSVRTAGRDGKLGTADDKLVGIDTATYDPTALTVTLRLAVAVPINTKLLLMINKATDVPGQGVGVSDLLGNLLDGNDDGHPGGSYSADVVAQPAPAKKTSSEESTPSPSIRSRSRSPRSSPAASQPPRRRLPPIMDDQLGGAEGIKAYTFPSGITVL